MTARENRVNNPSQADDWLGPIILEAKKRHRCTKIMCTTCGATRFREAIQRAVLARHGDPNADFDSFECQRVLVDGLQGIQPIDDEHRSDFEEAVRFVMIRMVWMTNFGTGLDEELAGTLAGKLLDDTRRHYADVQQARTDNAQRAEAQRVQSARRRQLRQEAHAQRLIEQAERSKRWHEQNDQGTGGEGGS